MNKPLTMMARIVIIVCTAFSVTLLTPSIAFAQIPASMMSSSGDEGGKDNGDQQSQQESVGDETDGGEADSSGAIGISDAINFDSFVDRWEQQFNQWLADFGLGDSMGAQIVMTAIILVITLIVLWVVRKLVNLLQGKLKYVAQKIHISQSKLNFLYGALYWLFAAVVIFISLVSIGVTWGLDVEKFIANDWVLEFFSQVLTAYVLIFIAAVILEVAIGLVELAFHRLGGDSASRVNTLLPIAKNTVYIVLVVMFALVGLSEMGIDVMPLLAGAGVVGFAIGFAAQTFIKDLLMGFIIILEDLIQVGDVARVGGRVGAVERITIRKVQLRDLSGSVFTVPFSEISIVENLTKEFSCAVFDIGVAYREDVDKVMELLEQIGKDMLEAENVKDEILEPLEIFGLDKFGDSAIVIKARFKTKPIQQWTVSREFNRRVKIAFDKNGIEIPFPHQTIYFGEDKEGKAPPMRISRIDALEPAANENEPRSNEKTAQSRTDKSSLPNENEVD